MPSRTNKGTLHLRLLGGFEATVDRVAPVDLPTRKARALLALLATSPDLRLTRERLAGTLWERSAEEQARASLRQTLASTRKALAAAGAREVLAADAESIWLAEDRCEVDARAFEALVADGSDDSLRTAAALYAGDLLVGLSLRENACEEWLAAERRQLQDRARQVFDRLLARSLEGGDFHQAAATAARLLAIDPLQEHVHRALMRIHAAEGRRSLALRQFETCRELLARELDVAPDPETVSLAESIREAAAGTLDEDGSPDARDSDAGGNPFASAHSARTAFPGEIRPVTILFARFSPDESEEPALDLEQHQRIAQAFVEAASDAVARYGGRVDNRLGDSVVAVFGVPVAHGNDAERALRAALDIRAEAPIVEGVEGRAISAHVGVAPGQTIVHAGDTDRDAYTIAGDGLDLAHQLERASAPGEVLATESIAASAARFFETQPVRDFQGRSRGRALEVARVRSLRDAPHWVRATRFVGRRIELAQIASVLDAVAQDPGRAHIVYVRGEPGIGKTRLLEETATLAASKHFDCFGALILDFGTSNREEVQSILAHGLLGIAPDAVEEARVAAIAAAVDSGRIAEERRVFLNDLIDLPQPLELKSRFDAMDDGVRNQGRIDALSDLVRDRSTRRPVLIGIEDLHWASPPVVERLAVLANAVRDAPVVFLMTSRAEGDPLDRSWRTMTREIPLVTIDLSPLTDTEAAQIANHISRQSEELRRRCIERAQGNPLFLEQLLRATSDGDASEAIPSSVQELALSRSDRLATKDRDALRAASVLGQRFDVDALRALLDAPGYVCDELVRHDLVRPERGGYLFAHALIRDGIYASLLSETRRALHLGAAEWFAPRDLGLHANHLDAAQDPRAPEAYLKAAHHEFHAFRIERALELLASGLAVATGDDLCRLLNLKGEIRYHVGPTTESLTAYRSALAAAPADAERCQALVGMAMGLRLIDDYDAALAALDEAEPIAHEEALWAMLARACITRANIAFSTGQTERCLPYGEQALDYARRTHSVELETHALGVIGDALYAAGRMRSAHEHFLRCIDTARRNGLGALEVAHLCQTAGGTLNYMLELRRSLAESKRALALSREIGSLRSETQSSLSISSAAFYLGELAECREHAEHTLRLADVLGAQRTKARYHHYLARILIVEGKQREAREHLEEGLRIASESGIGYVGGSILGTLGRATEDPRRRREIFAEGEALLARGAVGHNFIEFYDDAMEACLENGEWDAALGYADRLENYVGDETLPFTDLIIARARALASIGKGERSGALAGRLTELIATARAAGLALVIPTMEEALVKVKY